MKDPNSPQQFETALIEIGIDVIEVTKSQIVFWFKGNQITFFFKKQWATGRGIKDGRGWKNLYNQIK